MIPVELESVHFLTPTKFGGSIFHHSPIDAKALGQRGLKGARLYAVPEGVVIVEESGRNHLVPWSGLGDGCSVSAKAGWNFLYGTDPDNEIAREEHEALRLAGMLGPRPVPFADEAVREAEEEARAELASETEPLPADSEAFAPAEAVPHYEPDDVPVLLGTVGALAEPPRLMTDEEFAGFPEPEGRGAGLASGDGPNPAGPKKKARKKKGRTPSP